MYDPLNVSVNSVPQKDFPMLIEQLECLKDALQSKDDAKCRRIGLTRAMLPPGAVWADILDSNLDTCCWQLSQFKKYSTPSRLADAVADLEFVVKRAERLAVGPDGRDVIPRYTLACALGRVPGWEKEARAMFEREMEGLSEGEVAQVSAVWAQAEWARLVRRMGEVQEAERIEKRLRDWWVAHPFSMAPSKFKKAVLDDGETTNPILDGIKDFGKDVVELPDGKGMIVKNAYYVTHA